MNTVAIILAIVVVLLFYILYNFFLLKSTELTASADLNGVPPAIPITNGANSLRYAYGIWIYVNSWSSGSKTIFSRPDNITLSLDSGSPVLNCDFTLNDTAKTKTTVKITDNFPLQKWTHIVVSVDNQYVDAYLDGKLIKSGRVGSDTTMPNSPTGDNIVIGSNWDAHVSKFQYWAEPIDPQTVWTEYMDGNGQGNVTSFASSYGIDLSILKDNVKQSTYNIM
jgi:hypothetical protein